MRLIIKHIILNYAFKHIILNYAFKCIIIKYYMFDYLSINYQLIINWLKKSIRIRKRMQISLTVGSFSITTTLNSSLWIFCFSQYAIELPIAPPPMMTMSHWLGIMSRSFTNASENCLFGDNIRFNAFQSRLKLFITLCPGVTVSTNSLYFFLSSSLISELCKFNTTSWTFSSIPSSHSLSENTRFLLYKIRVKIISL